MVVKVASLASLTPSLTTSPASTACGREPKSMWRSPWLKYTAWHRRRPGGGMLPSLYDNVFFARPCCSGEPLGFSPDVTATQCALVRITANADEAMRYLAALGKPCGLIRNFVPLKSPAPAPAAVWREDDGLAAVGRGDDCLTQRLPRRGV
jgi:hypothetical protein